MKPRKKRGNASKMKFREPHTKQDDGIKIMKTNPTRRNTGWSFISLVLVLFAAGCAPVRCVVTPFYQSPLPPGNGKTFFVCPLDKGNMNNPEFFEYAGRVACRLEQYGFKLAGTNRTERADYVVLLGYGINEGAPMTYSIPIFDQVGGGVRYHSGSFSANTMSFSSGNSYKTTGNYSGYSYSPPQYGIVGSYQETVRQFDRFMVVAIGEWKTATVERLNIIYLNRVKSSGPSDEIAMVLPSMIDAMFVGFPGVSGKSRYISR